MSTPCSASSCSSSLEALDDVVGRADPRAGPRRAAAARRARRRRVVHHDAAADLSEPGDRERHVVVVDADARRCCGRRGRPSSRTRRAAGRSRARSRRRPGPVAWWRSTTAILAMSRAGSAIATPCSTVGQLDAARSSAAARARSRSRARGRPVEGTRRSERPTRRRVHRLAHPDRHLGARERRDGLAVEHEPAVLVDAARRGTRRGRRAARGRRGSPERSRRRRPGRGTARGAATRAAARPRARCPSATATRHIWSMWPSRTRKSGSRSSVQNAQRSGPNSRTSGSSAFRLRALEASRISTQAPLRRFSSASS